MAAIANIRIVPNTGSQNPVVTFHNGDQDQGGEIRASTANPNISQGSPGNLHDDQIYKVFYTSAGHPFGPVKRKYEEQHPNNVAIFIVAQSSADDEP
jgi:hypothetical protein